MRAGLLLLAALPLLSPAGPESDPRSQVLLERSCSSELGERRVTLFANGTVRLIERRAEETELRLAELDEKQTEGYRKRLEEEDLSESEPPGYGASGEWVEQCELTVALKPAAEKRFRYARFDSLPLGLARVTAIADELAAEAERQARMTGFPPRYRPRSGDRLERADGVLFEIVGHTGDGRGLELRGVEQPLVVYIDERALFDEFVRLIEDDRE